MTPRSHQWVRDKRAGPTGTLAIHAAKISKCPVPRDVGGLCGSCAGRRRAGGRGAGTSFWMAGGWLNFGGTRTCTCTSSMPITRWGVPDLVRLAPLWRRILAPSTWNNFFGKGSSDFYEVANSGKYNSKCLFQYGLLEKRREEDFCPCWMANGAGSFFW